LPEAIIASLATPKTGRSSPSPALETDDASDEPEPVDPPRLVVACGRAKGRQMPLDEAGFFVGRDPGCRLRTASDTVSRRHAHIRAVGGRVYVRDLGSTNGTLLNDRLIRGQEVEVRAGDRLEIGPLKFTFAFGPAPARSGGRALREEEIIGWLGLDCYSDGDSGPAASDEVTAFDLEGTAQHAGPTRPIRCQVIEDTVVVTPLNSHVVEELDVEALRQELLEQLDKVLPRRVVVNLQHVISLSGAAVGMLVAHHLRLDRVGGALRLSAANSRVAMTIDQIRLPLLLEVYPTVDEAVLAVWDRDEQSA
jgi:anti-anti-sigma factor